MAILNTDNFNRADNTDLSVGGFPWGGGSGITIVSNQISFNGSVDTEVQNTTSIPGDDNAYCQAKITVSGAGTESGPGLFGTKTDGVAYRLVVATASPNITLARLNPSYSVLWNRSATFANGDTVRLEVQGTALRVLINGVAVGADATIPSWVGTLKVGMSGSSFFTSGAIDDWEMGTLDIFSPATALAQPHAGHFGPF